MKGIYRILFPVLLIASGISQLKATGTDSLLVTPAADETSKVIKMDFLSSYYQQDGNRSAVTGGEGPEELKDFAGVIKINIPLKNRRSLQFDTRLNYFSSASSDNIDPKTNTGASRNDIKVNINAAVTRELKGRAEGKAVGSFTWEAGASHEAHFASINAGLGLGGKTGNNQGEWSANISYVMDVWGQYYDVSKLYPSDFRGREGLDGDKRHTLSAGFSYKQIVNPSLKFGFSAEVIQQFGLLSTPFHRIYFSDDQPIDIERLPSYRLRVPIAARLNYYAADWLVFRTYYRFYWDNFELKAHSAYIEVPVKPVSQLTIYPYYRFHHQQGHEYFAPKGEHISTDVFYTSDHDQSDLHSHFCGGGLRWTPFFPNRKKEGKRAFFDSVDLRGAYYHRSDGFHSWIVSGGISWSIIKS